MQYLAGAKAFNKAASLRALPMSRTSAELLGGVYSPSNAALLPVMLNVLDGDSSTGRLSWRAPMASTKKDMSSRTGTIRAQALSVSAWSRPAARWCLIYRRTSTTAGRLSPVECIHVINLLEMPRSRSIA